MRQMNDDDGEDKQRSLSWALWLCFIHSCFCDFERWMRDGPHTACRLCYEETLCARSSHFVSSKWNLMIIFTCNERATHSSSSYEGLRDVDVNCKHLGFESRAFEDKFQNLNFHFKTPRTFIGPFFCLEIALSTDSHPVRTKWVVPATWLSFAIPNIAMCKWQKENIKKNQTFILSPVIVFIESDANDDDEDTRFVYIVSGAWRSEMDVVSLITATKCDRFHRMQPNIVGHETGEGQSE